MIPAPVAAAFNRVSDLLDPSYKRDGIRTDLDLATIQDYIDPVDLMRGMYTAEGTGG